MIAPNIDVVCWNVRGLNNASRCLTVHDIDMLAATNCHLACLQETKLSNIDGVLAGFLGGHRLSSFAYKPAVGTKGGILLLWNDAALDVHNIVIRRFSITASVTIRDCLSTFLLTTVYGPTRDNLKGDFLRELRRIQPDDDQSWLVLGDFNLIYRARDKNNTNLNLRRMRQFRTTLNRCRLKEIHLQNRKYTWSNKRRRPTLARLDRVFCNEHWDLEFGQHGLQALSTAQSDHCPLLLSNMTGPRQPRPFRFENFWVKLPGFREAVQHVWSQPTPYTQPFRILRHKLLATARHLRSWSRTLVSEAKLLLHMALDVVHHLDIAQETRELSTAEFQLRRRLKRRILGPARLRALSISGKAMRTRNFFI